MTSAVLTLAAALQSWGGPAVSQAQRPTDPTPSLSGVAGLIANALGRPRDMPVADLAAARLHVRVDRPGRTLRDYHTAGTGAASCARCGNHRRSTQRNCPGCGGPWQIEGVPKAETLDTDNMRNNRIVNSASPLVTERWYLSDAAFTAIWEPADPGPPAEEIAEALLSPARPLYLGRRCCPPDAPVLLGTTSAEPETVFESLPLLRDPPEPAAAPAGYIEDIAAAAGTVPVTAIYHHDTPSAAASARHDVPVSFDPASRWHYHHHRWTRAQHIEMGVGQCAGRSRDAWTARRAALQGLS